MTAEVDHPPQYVWGVLFLGLISQALSPQSCSPLSSQSSRELSQTAPWGACPQPWTQPLSFILQVTLGVSGIMAGEIERERHTEGYIKTGPWELTVSRVPYLPLTTTLLSNGRPLLSLWWILPWVLNLPYPTPWPSPWAPLCLSLPGKAQFHPCFTQ